MVVCYTMGLAIYIEKYLKAKEELWKFKNISPCKNIHNLEKKSTSRNQNPSRYYNNSIITNNLKFLTQAKISSFKKPLYTNRPTI